MSLFFNKKYFVFVSMALFIFLFGISHSFAINAGLARPDYQNITLNDGQMLRVKQVGDENSNFIIDEDNNVVDSHFNRITNLPNLHSQHLSILSKSDEKNTTASDWRNISGSERFQSINLTGFPVKELQSQQNLLVVLINFEDKQIRYSEDVWSSQFFGSGERTVNTYYDEVSGGKFEFIPAQETYGQKNDGVISVTLDYPHPDPGSKIYKAYPMVADAL